MELKLVFLVILRIHQWFLTVLWKLVRNPRRVKKSKPRQKRKWELDWEKSRRKRRGNIAGEIKPVGEEEERGKEDF